MTPTTTLYITDKSGDKLFKTICSTEFYTSEERNLNRKLKEVIDYPEMYGFIDMFTARIVIEHDKGSE